MKIQRMTRLNIFSRPLAPLDLGFSQVAQLNRVFKKNGTQQEGSKAGRGTKWVTKKGEAGEKEEAEESPEM